MNDFSNLSAENEMSHLAQVQPHELEQPANDDREPVVVKLEDDGDEDRTFWQYVVNSVSSGLTLHVEPVNKHKHNRQAAYMAASTWANDNNYLIVPM